IILRSIRKMHLEVWTEKQNRSFRIYRETLSRCSCAASSVMLLSTRLKISECIGLLFWQDVFC
ncbi:hypothetical protein, partial [Chryseobacterium indoltheticum]|uniref:hypothetical protein n=1 Tax=Chryseobacterium indoltheticum TaxID=254 RepID=UPI003F496CD1